MYNGKKVIVVMPAYRAALTLERTYREIPFDLADEVPSASVVVRKELVPSVTDHW